MHVLFYELSDFDGQAEAIPLSNHSVIDQQVELFALLSLAAVAVAHVVMTVVLFMVPIVTFVATTLYSKHQTKEETTEAKAGRGSKHFGCGTAKTFVEAWDGRGM